VFDCLVVGKGLFGAAATRHLSRVADRVGVLGPDEPARWEGHDGVFASHYDQGRIVSATGPDAVWNALRELSTAEYRAIEEASGVPFYVPVGLIRVCRADSPRIRQHSGRTPSGREGARTAARFITPEAALAQYQLRFPDGYRIVVEGPPSGYLNPREMILGQLALAEAKGAAVIRETATNLALHGDYVTVSTREGNRYESRKVLLATGAYANSFDLLRRKLACRVKSETTILGRVPESESRRLHGMPPVVYEVESPVLSSIYLLPPIRYPDGHWYVKLGCNTRLDRFLCDFDEMRDWMAHGDSDLVMKEMQEAVLALIPELAVTDWRTKRCLVTYTPSGKPFIDGVEPGRVYVAVGGNGKGAHPSDAIGRIAAGLVMKNEWCSPLDRDPFRVEFAES